MKSYKTKAFARFARKERLDSQQLHDAVASALAKPDANLGGEVIKQRVARAGGGKSGGYRAIILLRSGTRAVFAHGFAKKDAENISPNELSLLKVLAAHYLNQTDAEIAKLVEAGELTEVEHADEESEELS